jgi:hypothetical protein
VKNKLKIRYPTKQITILLAILFLFAHTWSHAQQKVPFFQHADSINKKRLIGISSGIGIAWMGSMAGLYQVWYKNIPQSKFHFFNDGKEWMQMDKMGHGYTAYWISNRTSSVYQWAGLSQKKALWIGAGVGLGYQTTLEIFDGFSSQWGFSWSDMLANTSGILLFGAQELIFKKQIITPKFSYFPSKYAQYRPSALGSNFAERLLKDYNAQTYWFSINIASLMPKTWKFPKWLNLAFGYSINEKLAGYDNYYTVISANGNKNFSAYRQFLLSLDIDLSKIPVKKPWLKALLSTLNTLKIPFPAIGFSTHGTRGYWMYY